MDLPVSFVFLGDLQLNLVYLENKNFKRVKAKNFICIINDFYLNKEAY